MKQIADLTCFNSVPLIISWQRLQLKPIFLIIYGCFCSAENRSIASQRWKTFPLHFSTKGFHFYPQQPIAKTKTNFQIEGMVFCWLLCCGDGWCMIGNRELEKARWTGRDMELYPFCNLVSHSVFWLTFSLIFPSFLLSACQMANCPDYHTEGGSIQKRINNSKKHSLKFQTPILSSRERG